MSPLRRHILYSFASWQNRLFGVLFGPSSVKGGRTHIVLGWMTYVVCLHLYIPWNLGSGGLHPAELRGRVCLFVCPSRYDARYRKLDGAYMHWTWGNGHKPPGQKSPGQKTPWPKVPPAKSAPRQKTPGKKVPRAKDPPAKRPPAKKCPAATYSIAAVAGNWTILVLSVFCLSVTLLLGQLYTATSRVNIDHARHRKPRRCVR